MADMNDITDIHVSNTPPQRPTTQVQIYSDPIAFSNVFITNKFDEYSTEVLKDSYVDLCKVITELYVRLSGLEVEHNNNSDNKKISELEKKLEEERQRSQYLYNELQQLKQILHL